jgi:guanylate kinase
MSIVFIISAPSGSGKSTLVNEVRQSLGLDFSVSYTTRPPRGNEQNGREYFFVARPQFAEMLNRGEFLEHAEVFGNYYGTSRRFLRDAEGKGNDLVLDIDVQGAQQIRRQLPDAVSIFILPPDRETLEQRLRHRSLDAEEVIQRRLDTARREIENYGEYAYILVNDRLDESTEQLRAIVQAERSKRSGQPHSPEDARMQETAERCRLSNARARVQPILASFAAPDVPKHSPAR